VNDDLLARWEALDEREQKIESMRVVRSDAFHHARRYEPPSLSRALEAEHVPSRAELRELVGATYRQPVISLYLGLAEERGPREVLAVLDSLREEELAARGDMVETLPANERFALRRDLHEIHSLVRALEVRSASGLVVFKSGHELNRALTLAAATVDALTIDRGPRVEPLLAVLEEYPKTLVVVPGEERSQFWSHHLDHLEEIQSAAALAVARERAEATRERSGQSVLTPRQWHLMTTAQIAGQLFTERECSHVVLSGDGALLDELDCFLPDSLRDRVVGRVPPGPGRDRAVWQREIEAELVAHRRALEEAAVGGLKDEREARLVTSGLAGVIEVLNHFLARKLVIGAGLREPGFACRQHHFLSLRAGGCPFCGAELVGASNLSDWLIGFARLHGVDVMLIEVARELLTPYQDVAVVRFDLSSR
jgi:hypothetical protein